MIDGDDTYKSSEILRLIEPLESGFCDAVLGSRLAGKMNAGAMRGFNRFGNWIFSVLVRTVYKANVTDTLTGFIAWRSEVVRALRNHITSTGFAIEMEMITKQSRLGFSSFSVPITYAPRVGDSCLRPVRDGLRILTMFARQLFWRPRPKKVAFVSDAVYPFHVGGKEKRLFEISRRLAESGADVHIYTMNWWGAGKSIDRDGVHFHAISRLRPLYKEGRRSTRSAILFGLACFKMIGHRFDVVDVDHMPFFPLFSMRAVCWLKGARLHATWHEVWGRDYWDEYLGGMQGYLAYTIEKLAMRMPDAIVSVSEHTTRRLKASGVKCEIATVPLGVDFEQIDRAKKPEEECDVIYVGRLLGHKNVDMLIRSLEVVRTRRPDVRCIVIGDGPERPLIQALVAALGLESNVRLLGFLDDENDMYGYIKVSKVLVLPSVREGFGLVVGEANACNVPVVTLDHADNAARDLIIEGENGYLCAPDEASLAVAIERVLDQQQSLHPLEILQTEFSGLRWSRVAEDVERALAQ